MIGLLPYHKKVEPEQHSLSPFDMRKHIILLLASLLLGIALCEVLLRIFTPDALADKRVRRADPLLNHSLVPSTGYRFHTAEWDVEYRTNSDGFHDHEFPAIGDSAYKIALIGDSFAEGFGVELDSSIGKRLERSCNAVGGRRRVAVMNFGLAGYSPLIEYVLLTNRVLAYRPDLVIQCYDMSDVKEDHLYAMLTDFDGRRRPLSVLPVKPSNFRIQSRPWWWLKGFIQSHSYLYSLMTSFPHGSGDTPDPGPPSIDGAGGRHMLDSTEEYWAPYFEASQKYLKLCADTLRSLGITFVLCTYPYGIQVSPEEWKDGRMAYGFGSGIYRSAIFQSLEKFAQIEGVPFVNMTAAFKARSDGSLYFRYDPHWTSRGHRVAADTLFTYLQKHHWLP
jgi:hypothetical protein